MNLEGYLALISKDLLVKRQAKIELAKISFWAFCQVIAPDFYIPERVHLKKLCNTLESLYFGRLIKGNGKPYTKLMINMPPQHGKSRTLVNFACWVLGLNCAEKIITASYNDITASDFSKYVRDCIILEKNNDFDICYKDIFPHVTVKSGNRKQNRWAVEGQHFTYLGAGVGGSITSKGGTILIVDDPIKGVYEAYNENALEKIWKWYTGTFISRVSANNGEPLEIINMTRWSKKDICGRILSSNEASEWYVVKMEAYDNKTGKMLCPQILSKNRYDSLKKTMDSGVFFANYHQQPVDVTGRLYTSFKTYKQIPVKANGDLDFSHIFSYTDTADCGADYLCSLVVGVKDGLGYILDVVYSTLPMEETEITVCDMLNKWGVNTALIESNNGGRGFSRNVERLLWERNRNRSVAVKWFHQSKNKNARILTGSSSVMQLLLFPENWDDMWSDYYSHMFSYLKSGNNLHDDCADATTGVVEYLQKGVGKFSGVVSVVGV